MQEGSLGLLNTGYNRSYSQELKTKAVEAYQSGEGSLSNICIKFRIRATRQLREWIKLYNNGKNFKKKVEEAV
ncbi:helix-turn-helix domain-containing protein [Alkalibacterium sp. 20]|uniref:helix-turn-helix domain-containing protein n=1 Tax=Alkalibacterium sp. 20 TaxID=1798803 RepID=UPI0009003811|nr:hypothetical protein AX762_11220 [Alkalibacterium sp. 20]